MLELFFRNSGIPDKEGVCNDHGKCVCPNFFGFEKDKSKKCVWQESCNHCSKNAICENGKCSCVRGYTGTNFILLYLFLDVTFKRSVDIGPNREFLNQGSLKKGNS